MWPEVFRQADRSSGLTDGAGRPISSIDHFAIPHVIQASAVIGGAWKTYLHGKWDEARRNSLEDARVMYRDTHLRTLLEERKRACLQTKWHVKVDNERDPYEKAVKDGLQKIGASFWRYEGMNDALLEALWFGRAATQTLWEWDEMRLPVPSSVTPGNFERQRVLKITAHQPVHGDSIGHHYDGTPYVLVNSAYAHTIPRAEIVYTTAGAPAVLLRGTWRSRFLLHQHKILANDFFEPEKAGGIGGYGLRDMLAWVAWLKKEYLADVVAFMHRVGLGVSIWYYDGSNPQSRLEVQKAATAQTDRLNLLVPIWGDNRKTVGGLERIETPVAGCEMLLAMMEHLEKMEERLIVGQASSARSETEGGLGTTDTTFQQQTKKDITKEDCTNLGWSHTGCAREPGWLYLAKKYTYPDADFPAWLEYDVEEVDPEKRLGAATMVFNMGVDMLKDELRGTAGFSKPVPGDDVVVSPAFMPQPAVGPDGQPLPGAAPGMPPNGEPGAPGTPPAGAGGPSPEPPPEHDDESDPVFEEILRQAHAPDPYEAEADPEDAVWQRGPDGRGLRHAETGEEHPDELDLSPEELRELGLEEEHYAAETPHGAGAGTQVKPPARPTAISGTAATHPTPLARNELPHVNAALAKRPTVLAHQPTSPKWRPDAALPPGSLSAPGTPDWVPLPTPGGGERLGWHNPLTGEVVRRNTKPTISTQEHAQRKADRENAPPQMDFGWDAREQQTRRNVPLLFGDRIQPEELHRLVGSPPGSTIEATPGYVPGTYGSDYSKKLNGLKLSGQSHQFQAIERNIEPQPSGDLVMHSHLNRVKRQHQGSGVGGRMFAAQVQAAVAAGVDRIENLSMRGRGWNGYVTWPSLGYDGPIPHHLRSGLPPALAGARTILDLYETPEGKQWWQRHGEPVNLTFDLTPGSRSLRWLSARLQRQGKPPIQEPTPEAHAAHKAERAERWRQAGLFGPPTPGTTPGGSWHAAERWLEHYAAPGGQPGAPRPDTSGTVPGAHVGGRGPRGRGKELAQPAALQAPAAGHGLIPAAVPGGSTLPAQTPKPPTPAVSAQPVAAQTPGQLPGRNQLSAYLEQHRQEGTTLDYAHVFGAFPWHQATPADHAALDRHLGELESSPFWRAAHAASKALGKNPGADALREHLHSHMATQDSGAEVPLNDTNHWNARTVDTSSLDPRDQNRASFLLRGLPKAKGLPGGVYVPSGLDLKELLGKDLPAKIAKPFRPAEPARTPEERKALLPPSIRPHLRDEEIKHLNRYHVANFMKHYKRLPSDKEFLEAAKAGEAKKGWYAGAARHVQETFGGDAPRFAALLAALSPRQPVKNNMSMAMQIWRDWDDAGRPTQTVRKMIPVHEKDKDGDEKLDKEGKPIPKLGADGKPIMREATTMPFLSKIPGAEFGSRLPNTLTALLHPEEDLSLSGQKVESFRRNLLGDLDASTNDVWMANFADVDQKLFGTRGGYNAFTAKVRKAAAQLGWKPAEVQETIWSFFRSLAGLRKAGLSRTEALDRITHEHVAGTEDFKSLMMEDPDVRAHLEHLGLGRADDGGQPAGDSGTSAAPSSGQPALTGRIQGGDQGVLERLSRRAGKHAASADKPDLSKLAPRRPQEPPP